MTTRACRVCGEIKPLTMMAGKRGRGGEREYHHYCRSCDAARAKKWRQDHLEYARQRDRAYHEANREERVQKSREYNTRNRVAARARSREWRTKNRDRHINSVLAWMKANPEKVKEYQKKSSPAWVRRNYEKKLAHCAVHEALKSGKLVRQACEDCGAPKTHAHHHMGYAKEHRLNVQWLCPKHHKARHLKQVAA